MNISEAIKDTKKKLDNAPIGSSKRWALTRELARLERSEAEDCLRLAQQLAGGQDWREWLERAEEALKIQKLIISYGLNHKKLEQLLLDTINWESEQ